MTGTPARGHSTTIGSCPGQLCGPGSVLGDYTLPTSYPTGALYTMHRRTFCLWRITLEACSLESPCLFQRNSFHLPGSITATTSHGPPLYNFWYHPMETTPGHLWGIFYTFLLLFQGSLFFTQLHLNSWWRLSLEMLVLPHAILC